MKNTYQSLLLLVLIFISASKSNAQASNTGCYVINGQNTCAAVDLDCSVSDPLSLYGYTTGTLCNIKVALNAVTAQRDQIFASFTQCFNNSNDLLSNLSKAQIDLDTCNAKYSSSKVNVGTLESDRRNWKNLALSQIKLISTQTRLISKLKRACASKCSRVR